MGYFQILMMGLCVVGMIALRKMKNKNIATKLSLVCFGFLVLFGIFAVSNLMDDGSGSMREDNETFYISQGAGIGEAIKKKFGKKRHILMICRPDEFKKDYLKNLCDQLEEYSDANKVFIVPIQAPSGKEELESPPLESIVTTKAFDDALGDRDVDVIVMTFVPMPEVYSRTRIYKRVKEKKYGLYLVAINDSVTAKKMIKDGILTGATVMKNTASPKDKPAKELLDTFKIRYQLFE